jgi:hypothetical protein
MTTTKTLLVLLLTSLAVNIALSYKLSSITERHGMLTKRSLLKIGEWVEPFVAMEHGQETQVRVDTKPVVFYLVSAACGACKMNAQRASTVFTHAARTYDVIYVNVEKQVRKPEELFLSPDARVLHHPTSSTRSKYGLSGTPQTIVVRDGRIVANWVGSYEGSNLKEIERFFALKVSASASPLDLPSAAAAPMVAFHP